MFVFGSEVMKLDKAVDMSGQSHGHNEQRLLRLLMRLLIIRPPRWGNYLRW